MTPDTRGPTPSGRTARLVAVVLVSTVLVAQVAVGGALAATATPSDPGTGSAATDRPAAADVDTLAGGAGTATADPNVTVTNDTDGDSRVTVTDHDENGPRYATRQYGQGVQTTGSALLAQSTASSPIRIDYAVDRRAGHPNLTVTANVSLPSNVNELVIVSMPSDSTVTSTDGFVKGSDGDWETNRSSAAITYEMPFEYENRYGLEAVDEGSWAFTGEPVYGFRFLYRYTDADPGYEIASRSVSGNAVGDDFLFWGSHRVEDVSGTATPTEVVVPDAASFTPEVVDTIRSASENLSVGGRGSQVRGFVAPDPIREGGRTDSAVDSVRGFWVGDGAVVNSPENVWVHEYVHTRQTFDFARETRWFIEASAEYYAAYLTAEQGRIDFDSFHASVSTDRYSSAVLSEPSDWAGTTADYDKGARVLAALDAKVRAESGGSATLEDVFASVNGDLLTLQRFKDATERAAGTPLDGWIDQYVTTSDVPSVPDDPAAFGLADGRTSVQLAIAANATTVEAGSDVEFVVRRSDTGDRVAATVTVDDRSYSTGSDGAVTVTFGSAGEYSATATKDSTDSETYLGDSVFLTVEEPDSATFEVRDLSVPESVGSDEDVPVSATVENVGEKAGEVTVRFAVNGTVAANRSLSLDPGESVPVSANVSLDPGEYTVSVGAGAGNASATVTVRRPPEFAVRNLSVPDVALTSERLRVAADVTNVGETAGTENVTLRFDLTGDGTFDDPDDLERETTVDLDPDETTNVTFTLSLEDVPPDSYALGVFTPDDDARARTTVETPPEYELANPEVPASVVRNVTFYPAVEVTNAGGSTRNGTVSFRIDADGDGALEPSETVANETVLASPGSTITAYFGGTTTDVAPGTYTYGFLTPDGRVTGTVIVASGEDSNAAPRAEAGRDRTVTAGGSVTLDGSGSSDPDGESLSYAWVQTDGPSVSLLEGDGPTVTFEAPSVSTTTTLEFELTVDDGDATTTDTVTVTVTPPTGDAEIRRRVGSASVEPGGTVSVTLELDLGTAQETLSVQDGFEGPVGTVSIDGVQLDGEGIPLSKVVFARPVGAGVSLALSDLPANASLRVAYTVTVAGDAETGDVVRFLGSSGTDVAGPTLGAEFGTEAVQVGPSTGPVERFDGDGDGEISTDELNAAIQAWATDDLTTSALNRVIQAWATA